MKRLIASIFPGAGPLAGPTMKRLDAKNRVQAVVLAMQKGALTLQLMLALLTDF